MTLYPPADRPDLAGHSQMLSCWVLGPSSEERYARMQRKGWIGVCYSQASPYEGHRIRAYVAKRRPIAKLTEVQILPDRDTTFGRGVMTTCGVVWLKGQGTLDAFAAMLGTIPPRTYQFLIELDPFDADLEKRLARINWSIVRSGIEREQGRAIFTCQEADAALLVRMQCAADV